MSEVYNEYVQPAMGEILSAALQDEILKYNCLVANNFTLVFRFPYVICITIVHFLPYCNCCRKTVHFIGELSLLWINHRVEWIIFHIEFWFLCG